MEEEEKTFDQLKMMKAPYVKLMAFSDIEALDAFCRNIGNVKDTLVAKVTLVKDALVQEPSSTVLAVRVMLAKSH